MSENAQLNIMSHEQSKLSKVWGSLLRREKAGHFLPYMYGDPKGDSDWARFVKESDPNIQYTTKSEIDAIEVGAPDIASIISNDPDFQDQENLLLIENGSGSQDAIENKSLVLIKAFEKAGMKIGMYSPWEGSEEYRRVAFNVVSSHGIHVNPINADFNTENPNIATNKVRNVKRPRVVMEFGSSRGNIPTSEIDARSFAEQTYAELQRRFAHDRDKCLEGGYLVLGTDATQGEIARRAYVHEANAEFSENIIHRGIEEGVLVGDIDPDYIKAEPIWVEEDHTVKQTFVAKSNQDFSVLNDETGYYDDVSVKNGERFARGHSIKWPVEKIVKAAESQGFEFKGIHWGEDKRVPLYLFKEVPLDEPKRDNIVKFNR